MNDVVTIDATTAAVAAEIQLSPNELDFVEHWCRYRNSTQSYTHAFNTHGSYDTRKSRGWEILHRPRVQAAIKARLATATEEAGADVGWLLRRFLDIATADPRELIGLKVGACRYCHGAGHLYHWREREYLEALEKAEFEASVSDSEAARRYIRYPDIAGGFGYNATHPPCMECPQCHGEGIERFVPRDTDNLSDQALLLYGGVKAKRDGYEIMIADRSKALEMVGRVMGAFTDNLHIRGQFKKMVAVADLRDADPQTAAKMYQDFIGKNLSHNPPRKGRSA